ncbi:protein 5NUC-like isoform X2 [Pieris napi]|uniref:protein 5NUC-like isoform X2 n=1 Tax=Pieris napi TaxID=78633 RepID=UPI001FB9372E|nr:protein 5NUC-like isoform X2 [Pieris napi]
MAILLLTTVIAVIALSSSSIVKSPSNDGTFELLILHNNDMHARFEQTSQLSGACTTADRDAGKCYGGFPRVAHVVKEARKAAESGEGPPVLYLNAGDTYTGTAWFTIYKWKIAAEFLNALQPDAVSLGNHEFDNGINGLAPFIANLSCPNLATNLILDDEPILKAEVNLRNSVVFDINGIKVAVIGYLTPDTKFLAVRNNVTYIEEVIAIRAEVKRLRNEGVQIFIALGHSGFLKDLEIAKEVEDIDLVIGGHTNTFLWNGPTPDIEKAQGPYPMIVKQDSGRNVPVVQAYAYTKYIGYLHLTFDMQGEIKSIGETNPILLNSSIPENIELLAIVNKYRDSILKLTNVIVGSTSVFLDGQSCRLRECNLGNMITDAMVQKYASEYTGPGWTDTPIAIIQGGGIRASINHVNKISDITWGDLLTVMPFDDQVVKVTLHGTDLRKMLEHSVAAYNTIRAPGQFLQISGMQIEYDFRRSPGNRVSRALTLCGDCEIPVYSPLNDTRSYNVLINGFLSMGGDGYTIFIGKPIVYLKFNDLGATSEYVNKTSPVYPAIEGRIIIYNENALSLGHTHYLSVFIVFISVIVSKLII